MENQYKLSLNDTIMIYMRFAANIIIIVSLFIIFLQLIHYNIFQWFAKHPIVSVIYSFIIIICIMLYVYNRNFYLPFLGEMVYPCGSLDEKRPYNANTSVNIKVKPNTNIIYWASEPTFAENQPVSNPWDAYGNYNNSGVARSDSNGDAVLWVRKPSSYLVGLFNRKLESHIHYRECNYSGMLSEVKTILI